MGVISILLRLSKTGAALTDWGWLVSVAIFALPKHQPQIHFGRQGSGTGQLPIPGIAGTDLYLAADDTERHASFSYENVGYLLH